MSEIREGLIGKRFPVLDQGFVELRDVMGSDSSITDAARISYGKGTKSVSDDRTLIRHLYRHRHMSPFEMAEIVLAIRLPMDVMRQLIRHRTASINEYSTRYSEAIDAMQATPPDAWRLQSGANKQGSQAGEICWPSGEIADACMNAFGDDVTPGGYLSARERAGQQLAQTIYKERLAAGVAREQARKDLPLSTYTEAYWKCDLRNVLGMLALRLPGDAQLEVRSYAEVIAYQIVAKLFPITFEAFDHYVLRSVTLSALDIDAIRRIPFDGVDAALKAVFANARERGECLLKLDRLNLVPEARP